MVLTEEEIAESRSDIEKRIMEYFDSFSVFIVKLVDELLQMYQDGKLTKIELEEQLYVQLMDVYATNDPVINKQLELYLAEVYQVGLQSIDKDPILDAQDIGILYLLYKTTRRYIAKAQRDFLSQSLLSFEKSPTKAFIRNRFDMVIVTEGTRAFNSAIIVRTTGAGVRLQYKVTEDEALCLICAPYSDKIFFPSDCWHLLPQHVNCRCWFIILDPESEIIDIY